VLLHPPQFTLARPFGRMVSKGLYPMFVHDGLSTRYKYPESAIALRILLTEGFPA